MRSEVTTLDDVFACHTRWKLQLFQCLHGHSRLPAAIDISAADSCALGRFLTGEWARWHRLDGYEAATKAHKRFHAFAAEVVTVAERGDVARAARMIEPGTLYASASEALLLAVARLRAGAAEAGRLAPDAGASVHGLLQPASAAPSGT